MSRHITETDLALYISGDISTWKYLVIGVHTSRCEACRARMEAYRAGRKNLKQSAAEMPAGLDWDRMAAEMAANIRVGLAAGECVAPRRAKAVALRAWKPAAIAAGALVILAAAFWLNFPASDGQSLARSMRKLFQSGSQNHFRLSPAMEEAGPVVEASADGVELRENGVPVSIPQAASRPVAITVSAPGSASARYVDADTDQMTITSVYVQ